MLDDDTDDDDDHYYYYIMEAPIGPNGISALFGWILYTYIVRNIRAQRAYSLSKA